MPTIIQTVAGAAQFTGLAGAGLFSFSKFDALPSTSRVSVDRCAYHGDTGGNAGNRVDFYFVRPGGTPTEVVLLGRGLSPAITGPSGDADFTICAGLVPRDRNGDHWQLVAISSGKTVTASVVVDYLPLPYPSSSAEDPIP
jgi:hypothetical protein